MVGRERERRAPPYVSYKSWETFLDRVRRELLPLPQRLDTSVWRRLSFSGSTESAMKNCIVFLGLTTPDYQPTPEFEAFIVTDSDDERRRTLRLLIREGYGEILTGIDLQRATRGEVKSAFLRAGSGPETSDKAVSFFVSVAQEAEMNLHPQLTTRAPATKTRKRATSANRRRANETENETTNKQTENTAFNPERGTPLKEVHPALRGLLGNLPREGEEWGLERKDGFQRAWNAVLDFVYAPIEVNEKRNENTEPQDQG